MLEEYYQFLKNKPRPIAKCIIFEILQDLTNRIGLKNKWHEIDTDIQEEILEEWHNIVIRNLKNKE